MSNVAETMQLLSYALIMIGVLAFMVSMVVQVIKEMPGLAKIQTNAVALTVSLILCPVAVILACQYYKITVTWYHIFGAFISAFVVYLVATGGWERVREMWERTKYKKVNGKYNQKDN